MLGMEKAQSPPHPISSRPEDCDVSYLISKLLFVLLPSCHLLGTPHSLPYPACSFQEGPQLCTSGPLHMLFSLSGMLFPS